MTGVPDVLSFSVPTDHYEQAQALAREWLEAEDPALPPEYFRKRPGGMWLWLQCDIGIRDEDELDYDDWVDVMKSVIL